MKKTITIILAAILISAAMLIPCTVLAKDGRVTVSCPSDVSVGDRVEIAISAEAGSDCIGTFQSKLTYDKSLLEYVSGGGNSANISSGTGAISYTGSEDEMTASFVLVFRAKKQGTSAVEISYYLSGYNSGKTLVDASKTFTVTVKEAVPSPSPSASAEAQPSASQPVIDDMYFTVDGTLYRIMETVPDNTAGLVVAAGIYNGRNVPTVYFAGNTEKTYYFASNAVYEDNSKTLLYDMQAGTFAAYIPVSFGGTYLITEWERPITGFPEDAAAALSEKVSHTASTEFILVKAISSTGTEGYYFYDTKEGTMQRAITEE